MIYPLQKILLTKIPIRFYRKEDDLTFGSSGLLLHKETEVYVFKYSTKAIIERIKKLKDPALPIIIWSDGDLYIREYIYGVTVQEYVQTHQIDKEWSKWYTIESYKIWKRTSGHGDYTPFNIIIDINNNVRWIDINSSGDSFEVFKTSVDELLEKFTIRDIEEIINRFEDEQTLAKEIQ